MKGKYVVGLTRGGFGTSVVAMIFGDSVVHADVAVRMFGSKHHILGAGFVQVGTTVGGEVDVYFFGQSDSLGIRSRPEDRSYLEHALGMRERPDDEQFQQDRKAILTRLEAHPEAA